MSELPVQQTQRYERKREAILAAAASLFNARGLGGTTIAEVARAVGLTTASVTYYYRKKEDLAAACLMRAIGQMSDSVAQAAQADAPPARLTRFFALYFDRLAEVAQGRAPAMINFWDLRALAGPQAKPTMDAFISLFRDASRELFRDPTGPAFSLRRTERTRPRGVLGGRSAAKGWVERYETEDYPRAAARAADILINGLAGPGRHLGAAARLELNSPNTQDPGEVSRDAFLRAATELVNEYGYRGASVDRISAQAERHQGLVLPPQRHQGRSGLRLLRPHLRGDAPGAPGGDRRGAPGRVEPPLRPLLRPGQPPAFRATARCCDCRPCRRRWRPCAPACWRSSAGCRRRQAA